jgi:tetratricopeptide (TPR) repeat protein
MAKRSGLALALTLLVPASSAVVVLAPGMVTQSSAAPAVASAAAQVPTAAASGEADPALAFGRACAEGTGKFLAQDYKGALESFQGAVRLAPKNPLGHYLTAEAFLALGDVAEADASLRRADASTDFRTSHLRSKILFLVAVTKERAQKWDDARLAWQAYNDFVMRYVDGGGTFPLNATARIKAIDDALRKEKSMDTIRARIDASASGTLFNELPK